MESRPGALPALSVDAFNKLWVARFPHIKLPEYTAVQSKCVTCSLLDVAAEECTNKDQRAELRDLRKFHASMYRKQRFWYHRMREKAIREPENYLSCIGDGMAQVHNAIPSYSRSGTQTAPMTFDTHFQGMITHGKRFTIFRTFGNVGKGTNVAVHAWLRHLEIEYKKNGRLPDTLFIQIDGGGENANEIFPGMAELLVHWGLTKRIIITRLPVGHTHEDIDGKFGVIWNHNKMWNILTPQRQAFLTKVAFTCLTSSGKFKVRVEDVYAVPDYRRYIHPYAWLERVFKNTKENPLTQLQFIIEKVPVSEEFPLGARTMYRAYATDTAVEIVEKKMVPFMVPPLTTIELMAIRVDAINRPTSEDNYGGPEGARVMNCLPKEPLRVAPFKMLKIKEGDKTVKVDCKKYLDKVVYAMERHHGAQSKVSDFWKQFAATFPVGTADEYVESENTTYRVPFKEFFDRTVMPLSEQTTESNTDNLQPDVEDSGEAGLLRATATACAKWGIKGKGFPKWGTKVNPYAREFYPDQGLTGDHLIPAPERTDGGHFSKQKKGRSYKYWNKDLLRTELQKRGLDINGTNKVMVQRLEDDDIRKGLRPRGDDVDVDVDHETGSGVVDDGKTGEVDETAGGIGNVTGMVGDGSGVAEDTRKVGRSYDESDGDGDSDENSEFSKQYPKDPSIGKSEGDDVDGDDDKKNSDDDTDDEDNIDDDISDDDRSVNSA
jgi:hypothetical protein